MNLRLATSELLLGCLMMSAAVGAEVPLVTPRADHTVLVRSDGKIYVFGSIVNVSPLFELYTPGVGSRALAPPPTSGLRRQSTVLLSRDRILGCVQRACYLYSPDSDQWQTLSLGLGTALARLDDSHVMRAGDDDFPDAPTWVINTDSWTVKRVGPLSRARIFPALVRLRNGQLVAAGGWLGVPGLFPFPSDTLDGYDATRERWLPLARMPEAEHNPDAIALPDGRALVRGTKLQLYDPTTNSWQVLSDRSPPQFGTMTLLPDGQVLFTGGETPWTDEAVSATTIFDPVSGRIRTGLPLSIPRKRHQVAVLPDGSVLAMGGNTTGGARTDTVERVRWEPRVSTVLDPGYYVAAVTVSAAAPSAYVTFGVETSGTLAGGLNSGGTLQGQAQGVSFTAFCIPEAQRITIRVRAQPQAQGDAAFELRLLDAQRNPIAAPISGATFAEVSAAVPAGFYVAEMQSGQRSPPLALQVETTTPVVNGCAYAGSRAVADSPVASFVAFYLTGRQKVALRIHDEHTQRLTGDVQVFLFDAAGQVVAQYGNGLRAVLPDSID